MPYIKHSIGRWTYRHYYRVKHILPDHYFAFRFPWGREYLNPRACKAMVGRIFDIYETERLDAVRQLLRPGASFIDVGANMGDYGLLAASIVGGSGQVMCFEAEPNNCRWLRRNVELNGYKNVQVFSVALSDVDGEAQLHLGESCDFHSLLSDGERTAGIMTVRTRSLDNVMSEMGTPRVDMMKIDVEGAELAVLKGALATLKSNWNIVLLMELHPGIQEARHHEVPSLLRELGFSLFEFTPPFNIPFLQDDNQTSFLAYRV